MAISYLVTFHQALSLVIDPRNVSCSVKVCLLPESCAKLFFAETVIKKSSNEKTCLVTKICFAT